MSEIEAEEKKLANKNMSLKIPPRAFLYAAYVFGVVALLLVGFVAGQRFERIRFRHDMQWRNNYDNNFFGGFRPRNMENMMRNFAPPPMRSHGIIGTIMSVDDSSLIIKDNDGIEQSLEINKSTVVRSEIFPNKPEELKVGMKVAVLGRPDNKGQISAIIIKILEYKENSSPTPSATSSNNSTKQ